MKHLSFCVWNISLRIMSSRFIHVVKIDKIYFLRLNNIPLCTTVCMSVCAQPLNNMGSKALSSHNQKMKNEKMRRQRKCQLKEQEKSPLEEKNRTQIRNLPDKAFKTLVIKMLTGGRIKMME